MANYMGVEDLKVYQKLCQLHIEVCELTHAWPREERFELGSQVRRSFNSSPANLAEKHSDRHIRNKIEGVKRSRGEALETIHHLYIAKLKDYLSHRYTTRSASLPRVHSNAQWHGKDFRTSARQILSPLAPKP